MNKLKEFVAYTFILLILANILLASMFVIGRLRARSFRRLGAGDETSTLIGLDHD